MYEATWSVFSSKLRKYKKSIPEKFLTFSQKRFLLYFQKMELLYLGKWNIEAQARKKTN